MDSYLEIIAVLFSVLSTYFSIQKSVWCWIFGTIAVSAYFLLFYQVQLYADMGLQIIYLFQGFYGWYGWWLGKKHTESFVRRLSAKAIIIAIISTVSIAILTGWALSKFTGAYSPYIDALASSISLMANWLLAKRYLQNWFFWIVADMILIGLFWSKGLYLSSSIYLVFLLMCIKGFIDWNKHIVTKEALS
jgi:nicotinamide mononucleotide transporter